MVIWVSEASGNWPGYSGHGCMESKSGDQRFPNIGAKSGLEKTGDKSTRLGSERRHGNRQVIATEPRRFRHHFQHLAQTVIRLQATRHDDQYVKARDRLPSIPQRAIVRCRSSGRVWLETREAGVDQNTSWRSRSGKGRRYRVHSILKPSELLRIPPGIAPPSKSNATARGPAAQHMCSMPGASLPPRQHGTWKEQTKVHQRRGSDRPGDFPHCIPYLFPIDIAFVCHCVTRSTSSCWVAT
ncbi:hypothetical protein GGTG_09232 [Gaeumannomyces tritici R3-111a-1]|uniref:Uncharacterized protein n=1 Tax=Gaeumannomyces tritici (strain R3-111a-1) TaxID=644352 RepID=J3P6U0_GAET3|nr:hypothetical protein GGTG_09232 [Gaeumannomyces tritici R3-111a-1]EJT72366.1 hypothetical protein GGTG_09232 [Gaeumannomyces tritici R3-111a-1]